MEEERALKFIVDFLCARHFMSILRRLLLCVHCYPILKMEGPNFTLFSVISGLGLTNKIQDAQLNLNFT